MKETGSKEGKRVARTKNNNKSQYFQTIARHFFKWRGAPFFLSSKELDLIVRWGKMGIPLRVVLEGIRKSFENSRPKRGKKGKIFSLLFCNFQVLKAFEQYKERRVGERGMMLGREKKREKAKAEIEKFLGFIPPRVSFLRENYFLAKKKLSRRDLKEEELERLEEEIEEILFKNSPNEEKEKVRSEVKREYEFRNEAEFSSVWKIKLVKLLREKYKIPYISIFYY